MKISMDKVQDKKYAGWLWALKLVGISHFGWSEKTIPCPKSWHIYFDEGYTVINALIEDVNY